MSFEKFAEQEAVEMTSAKAHEQNLSRCMELADVRLVNDGSVAEFHAKIEAFLAADANPAPKMNVKARMTRAGARRRR